MSGERPLVGIIMGSTSDASTMKGCGDVLHQLGIPHELKVWAAHLAGFVAAHTVLPVIGVPIDSSPLGGLDALLSTVQMPPGVPVATVAVGGGGARNAAVLAVQILALKDPRIAQKLTDYRKALTREAAEKALAFENAK
jgi:phosphoribosylcarboxyaminoimidazole (NCAIR) mutase